MAKIVWTEEYSVGVAALDAQHRQWIGMINELHETLLGGRARELDEVTTRMLVGMAAYARGHFEAEEEHMAAIGFAGREGHILLHREFSARVDRLCREAAAGELILNTEVMKTLMRWLQDHILQEDRKYADRY